MKALHDLHVWALGTSEPALSVHLVTGPEAPDADALLRTVADACTSISRSCTPRCSSNRRPLLRRVPCERGPIRRCRLTYRTFLHRESPDVERALQRPPCYAYGTDPNDFLAAVTSRIPLGRVLSIGDGEGRNGVHLATLGYDVTSVDSS